MVNKLLSNEFLESMENIAVEKNETKCEGDAIVSELKQQVETNAVETKAEETITDDVIDTETDAEEIQLVNFKLKFSIN